MALLATTATEGLDTVADVVHDGHMTTTQSDLHSMDIDGVPADEFLAILRDAAREMRRQDSERNRNPFSHTA
jgi:hypothetical protein